MAKKRKDLQPTSTLEDEPRIMAEKREMMRLTKAAKSWEFTCSFCFKKFASAQAMGGHQNAHRSERLEEKRLSVRDPIGYRKRAFLRAVKAGGGSREVVKRAGFNGDSREKCKDSSVVNINGGDSNSALMNFLPHKVVDESVGDGIDLDLTLKL